MRSGWTAFTNTGLRLLLCLPLLSIFVLFVPDDTLGKGGTNIHEGLAGSRAAVPTYEPTLPSEGFGLRTRTLSRSAHAQVPWPGGFRQLRLPLFR